MFLLTCEQAERTNNLEKAALSSKELRPGRELPPWSFGLVLIVIFACVGKGSNKLNIGTVLLTVRPAAFAPFLSGLNPKA